MPGLRPPAGAPHPTRISRLADGIRHGKWLPSRGETNCHCSAGVVRKDLSGSRTRPASRSLPHAAVTETAPETPGVPQAALPPLDSRRERITWNEKMWRHSDRLVAHLLPLILVSRTSRLFSSSSSPFTCNGTEDVILFLMSLALNLSQQLTNWLRMSTAKSSNYQSFVKTGFSFQ